jgi:hypothetical protein
MDAKITSSIRLLPETWKTLQDFQRERRLASLGDAVHAIVEEWMAMRNATTKQRRRE